MKLAKGRRKRNWKQVQGKIAKKGNLPLPELDKRNQQKIKNEIRKMKRKKKKVPVHFSVQIYEQHLIKQ